MYYCQNCETLIQAGVKQHKAVTEVRARRYTVHGEKETKTFFGREAVKEKTVCEACYQSLTERKTKDEAAAAEEKAFHATLQQAFQK